MRLRIPSHPESLTHAVLVVLVGAMREVILTQQAELEELRRAGKRQASPYRRRKRKKNPKRPGRKAGEGTFTFRDPPADGEITDEEESDHPQTCPCCGSVDLEDAGYEDTFVTDIPPMPAPRIKRVRMWMRRCKSCRKKTRGRHPDIAHDQRGATAHRLGPRVKSAAHALHYGYGVPERKVPAILKALTGVKVTQGALAQSAVRAAKEGPAKERYQELRASLKDAAVTHTDDTGFRIGVESAQLMVFATPDTESEPGTSVFQIRHQHRNEEVREIIPSNYEGTMVTDRGVAYDAQAFATVKKQKCIAHVLRSIAAVLEDKVGAARDFGVALTSQLKAALGLRHQLDSGEMARPEFDRKARALDQRIGQQLAHRRFVDSDNQRLLNELGRHHDDGSLTRFLLDPTVPTTNNLAERELRPAVVARKVSHCCKTENGARAHECLTSVIRTEQRAQPPSLVDAVAARIYPRDPTPPH